MGWLRCWVTNFACGCAGLSRLCGCAQSAHGWGLQVVRILVHVLLVELTHCSRTGLKLHAHFINDRPCGVISQNSVAGYFRLSLVSPATT
ncbi:hypothetical protein B0H19DRAFT_106134 [Mycena capillaripes]|nr:hypothetical protein B0H19DRAFT_106134 [Mycena capillaripes]